jgi:5'-deoxy-5'-methylthioadenosine phosphorylase
MLAVIGGTGFGELAGLSDVETLNVATSFGESTIQKGLVEGQPVIFQCRHGIPASIPPHSVNYRANIQALVDQGCTAVIGVTAVGSVDESLAVPELVIVDQLIDYTWGRAHTFFDNEIYHIDFTFPYDEGLRRRLIDAASQVPGARFRDGGVYGCSQGPRLETAAEIERLRADGCHIVGMTACPEVQLARERNLPYGGISVVVNAGAGMGGESVDLAAIEADMKVGMDWTGRIVRQVVRDYSNGSDSSGGS